MSKQITFELSRDGDCIEIHSNPKGLIYLSDIFTKAASKGADHTHLMTENFGGNELSTEKSGADNRLINYVKIFCWENE